MEREHWQRNDIRCQGDRSGRGNYNEAEQILDAKLPRAYYDAFQTVIAHGNQARAKVFAERAYAARLGCEGEDSPGTLQIRLLAEKPRSHQLFGTSKRWRQNETKIPKGIRRERIREKALET